MAGAEGRSCAVHCSNKIKRTFLSIRPTQIPCMYKDCFSHHSKHELHRASEEESLSCLLADATSNVGIPDCDLAHYRTAVDNLPQHVPDDFGKETGILQHLVSSTCKVIHQQS